MSDDAVVKKSETTLEPTNQLDGFKKIEYFRAEPLPEEKKKVNAILQAVDQFVADIRSIAYTGPLAVSVITVAFSEAARKQKEFIEKNAEVVDEPKLDSDRGKGKKVKVDPKFGAEFKEILADLERLHLTLDVLPRSLLVTHVSQFDAYIGRLIKAVLVERPEILSSSESQITFKDLLSFRSLDDARDMVIDREIDKVLRESHLEHLKWFDYRIKIDFINSYDSMGQFIEIMERRNLCVHTDARVSRQYIAICDRHNALPETPPGIGDRLLVDAKYLQASARVLLEVGFFLGQRAARKLRKQDAEAANGQLVDLAYDLIFQKRYKTASRLLEYSLTHFADTISEKYKLMCKVNLANSYRLLGKKNEVASVLASEEWESKADEYFLASLVLSEKFEESAALMRKIGKSGYPTKHHYREWPLFSEFRQSKEFLSAYKLVFEEEFYYENSNQKDNIATDLQKSPMSVGAIH